MRKSDRHFASAIDTSKRPSNTLRKDVVAEITNRRKLSNAALGAAGPRTPLPLDRRGSHRGPCIGADFTPTGSRPLIATQHTETLAKISASSIKRAVERDIPRPLYGI